MVGPRGSREDSQVTGGGGRGGSVGRDAQTESTLQLVAGRGWEDHEAGGEARWTWPCKSKALGFIPEQRKLLAGFGVYVRLLEAQVHGYAGGHLY